MVSSVDGGASHRVSRRASRGDSEGGGTPAETRSARCGAVAAAAGGGSVSDDLDAVDRASRSASAPLAPPSMGSDAHARAERVARDRDGARGAARPHAVESRRPGAARRVARQLGRRKRNPDPQLVRRIDVDLFISSSYRLNESQFRLAGHLRGCDFAQNEKYLDVRGRTAFSSLPMDQLMLWEVGFQFLKDSGGKAAGANEKRDLHWNPSAHRVLSQDAPPSSP